MVVGENAKSVTGLNVVKGKKLTNVRASGSDKNIKLTPPTCFSLEENPEFLAQDETGSDSSLSDCAKLFWTNRNAVSLSKNQNLICQIEFLVYFAPFWEYFFSAVAYAIQHESIAEV